MTEELASNLVNQTSNPETLTSNDIAEVSMDLEDLVDAAITNDNVSSKPVLYRLDYM